MRLCWSRKWANEGIATAACHLLGTSYAWSPKSTPVTVTGTVQPALAMNQGFWRPLVTRIHGGWLFLRVSAIFTNQTHKPLASFSFHVFPFMMLCSGQPGRETAVRGCNCTGVGCQACYQRVQYGTRPFMFTATQLTTHTH